jgi:dihydropteroate synthase
MYQHAVYEDVVSEVVQELADAIARATAHGVLREAIIVDPGIGFAKKAAHSLAVIAGLDRLTALDRPILAGPSRKSYLKDALGDRSASEREWGTAAAVAACVLSGAHIVRVHGVNAMTDVVRVADRIRDVPH